MDFEPVLAMTTTESSDLEVEVVERMARGLHKFNLERNDSATSTASESSTKFSSSESDKLSAPPGAPIYTTDMIPSTWPTNFGHNFKSILNTPLNLLHHAVWDGGLNVGTNSTTGADEGTPKEIVSSDNTGGSGSLTTTWSVGQAFSRLQARGSDPIPSSPALRTLDRRDLNPQSGRARHPGADSDSPNITMPFRSPSPSHSPARSRAASPLPEGKFVPENSFKWLTQIRLSSSWCYPSTSSPRHLDLETDAGPGPDIISGPGTTSPSNSSNGPYNRGDHNLKFINVASIKSFCEAARLFVSDTLPRWVYQNFLLLGLPSMYSSRVSRKPGLEFNSQDGGEGRGGVRVEMPFHAGTGERAYLPGSSGRQGTAGVSGAAGFGSWEAFLDSLLKEWKTLNVVSAVLTSTILAILQIPEAADDHLTRSTGLLSFICALMSLLYGHIYTVRFGTMRSTYRVWGWAQEAMRASTAIWWNVWVLLAMPAAWMSWSMLLFLASILSFVWRTGLKNDPSSRAPLSATAALGPRLAITAVLALGLAYLTMIMKTLRRYDREWGEMKTDEEMRIGMDLDAVSVQGGEPGERGGERRERDSDRGSIHGDRGSIHRDRGSTRRRGGRADRYLGQA